MTHLLTICLLLSVVCAQAGLLVNSASLNRPITTVVTDASVTPTTNQLAVTGGMNGVRVWLPERQDNEPFFYLYVSRNGIVSKVKLFRWSGRIITASSGDTLSFGTTDGRPIYVTPMYAPRTTETITGTTGTANCDKAGPPIWSPMASHIDLPSNARAFSIVADGNERNIFISEYDGNSWTPARWLKIEVARNVTVRTSYRKIALANYDGASVSITAPRGTVIGGSSAEMSLFFPAITGKTISVTNHADFNSAVEEAVAGDEIVLEDGTLALTNRLGHGSFTANIAAGNRGFEGITFRSRSGNPTNCIIARSGDTNGSWIFDQRENTGKATYFKDLTFDQSCTEMTEATTNGMRFYNGNFVMQNCHIRGTNLVDTDGEAVLYFQTSVNNTSNVIQLLNCHYYNQSGRMLCMTGLQTNSPTGAGSTNLGRRIVVNCHAYQGGTNPAYHNLAMFYPISVGIYGGTYYDSPQLVAENGYNCSAAFYFSKFPQTTNTARSKNEVRSLSMFGCLWTGYAGSGIQPIGTGQPDKLESFTLFNSFQQENLGTLFLFRLYTNITVAHNILRLKTGYGFFNNCAGWTIVGNILTNAAYGFRATDFLGSSTNDCFLLNNTLDKCSTAIYSTNNAYRSHFTNNAASGSTAGFSTTADGMATITADYNVFDPTTAGYVAGAHDITNANAAFDANYFPTASGNCDGNGDTNAVDYVGSSDPYGLTLIYLPTRVSRGAREIPAVYANAVLLPDLW
jgi:hypothetical protein